MPVSSSGRWAGGRPAAGLVWPGPVAPGEPYAAVSETHSAVVFLAGDRAYKLKKPVDLGFLDFSTPAARERACHRETELNRRFAPDVYLGVAEVSGPAGEPGGHLVVMRRMPASRRLSSLVRAGQPVDGPLREVARALAVQHASAGRGPQIAAQGSRDALLHRWRDSFRQVRQTGGALPGLAEIDETQRLAERFLAGRAALFQARISAGRIVDGHGDLLADDIFCLDDGPRILDCLEFDDRLRWLDGLDDAAFLAMDLDRLGAPALAARFIGWYAEFAADPAPPALRHHYLAYRAFVRAKVGCLHSAQGDPAAAAGTAQLAELTLRHLRAGAVTLVLVGGLPGTGKSVLAGLLADQLGWTVLASDRIRKELAGLPPEVPAPAPFGAGIYTEDWTARTYAELLHRAAALLAMGESVILDASWASSQQRVSAATIADQRSADLVQLRCTTPAGLAAERMAHRQGSASDADPAIAARLARHEAPWPAAITIDTSAAAGAAGMATRPAGASPGPDDAPAGPVGQALAAIRPHGHQHGWRAGPVPASGEPGRQHMA